MFLSLLDNYQSKCDASINLGSVNKTRTLIKMSNRHSIAYILMKNVFHYKTKKSITLDNDIARTLFNRTKILRSYIHIFIYF